MFCLFCFLPAAGGEINATQIWALGNKPLNLSAKQLI